MKNQQQHRTGARAGSACVLSAILALATTLSSPGSDASLSPTALDSGGGIVTNARDVLVDSCIGGFGGVISGGAESRNAKLGYAGQLYDAALLVVTASPTSVNETASTQLSAAERCDDQTIAVLAGTATWAVVSGPILSITDTGVADTTNVYEDTVAIAQGEYHGRSGTVQLVVMNVDPDDFRTYAGDGLDDGWQVRHFGVDNPDAAPWADPDRDRRTNWYERATGTDPTTNASAFMMWIGQVDGDPGRMAVMFDPTFLDRTYRIQYRPDLLSGSWSNLTDYVETTSGTTRIVRHLIPTNSGFYRTLVEFTGP